MTRQSRFWVWVFGRADGLDWALRGGRMGFGGHAARRAKTIRPGDQAVLYLARGAHSNPTVDRARLAGSVSATARPTVDDALMVGGHLLTVFVEFQVDHLLPARGQGPEIRPLIPQLDFVRNKSSWGPFFRSALISISAEDFAVMESALSAEAAQTPQS